MLLSDYCLPLRVHDQLVSTNKAFHVVKQGQLSTCSGQQKADPLSRHFVVEQYIFWSA